MNEVSRLLRQIVVHDMRDVIHMNPARRHVGGDQYTVITVFEALQCFVPLALRAIAVDRGHLVFPALQKFREPVGALFGGHEDQERTRLVLEQMLEEIELGALSDFVTEEIDPAGRFCARLHRDSHRIVHVTCDQTRHRLLHGRGEKHGVAFHWKMIEDDAQRGQEAHIEHPIGLVENHGGGAGKIDQPPLQIIAETARRRDHHFGPGLDIAQLVGLAHAAHDHGGADSRAVGDLPECFIDLNSKLARGTKDQDFYRFGAGNGRESFDNRNRERQSLAGAGLRGRHDVAALHEWRNGLRLDGRWSDEFVLIEVVPQRGAKIEFGKMLYQLCSVLPAANQNVLSFQDSSVKKGQVTTMAAVLHKEPEPLEAPAELVRTRCLRKSPAERFQSTADLRVALASVKIGDVEETPSIAVLPFANLRADKDNEYFSDGLAEEILNGLTPLPGLRVVARASAFAFRGREHAITEVGEKLKVKNVLHGSVRSSGNRIRVNVQLIKLNDESQLWSERYGRELLQP